MSSNHVRSATQKGVLHNFNTFIVGTKEDGLQYALAIFGECFFYILQGLLYVPLLEGCKHDQLMAEHEVNPPATSPIFLGAMFFSLKIGGNDPKLT